VQFSTQLLKILAAKSRFPTFKPVAGG